MKTISKSIIIALSCFCAIDLVFIQSGFFLSCEWQPRNYIVLHPICENLNAMTSLFSTVASFCVASIVGISSFYSTKKSAIIVLALAGLYLLYVVLSHMYMLSLDATSATNSNLRIMRPMTNTEWTMHNIVWSPLWMAIPSAGIISAITWASVVSRTRIRRLLK